MNQTSHQRPIDDHPAALPLWRPEAYGPVVDPGVGAEKLAASAVAPLVAAARGYESIRPGELKAAADRLRIGALNSRTGAQFRSIVGRNGALMLPWHGPATVHSCAAKGGIDPIRGDSHSSSIDIERMFRSLLGARSIVEQPGRGCWPVAAAIAGRRPRSTWRAVAQNVSAATGRSDRGSAGAPLGAAPDDDLDTSGRPARPTRGAGRGLTSG